MKIAFLGHRNFVNDKGYEKDIYNVFAEIKNQECIEILLGGYGNFDRFALGCAKKLKARTPNISITHVIPYLNSRSTKEYDMVFYPSLENVPKKFAIHHRNRKMVDEADIIIAYVNHRFGGAYEAVKYGKTKNKTIINLANFEI